ncbi:hypothetical protein JCM11641_002347 [Rhodosporidiobolus odoratus]
MASLSHLQGPDMCCGTSAAACTDFSASRLQRPQTPSRPPQVSILRNEAALFSLKRPQLQLLCKEHGLRRGGKNVELIQRLQDYGNELLDQPTGGDDSMMLADESNASWAVLKEDVVPAQEELAEFGVQDHASTSSSWRAKASMSKSSSSGSIASTIRSAGTTMLRRLVDPAASTASSGGSIGDSQPQPSRSPPGPSPATVPSICPSLADAFSHSPHRPSAPNSSDASPSGEFDPYEEEGGIRLVSSRSTVHSRTSEAADTIGFEHDAAPPVPPLPALSLAASSSATQTPAFIFGSPIQNPAFPPPTFSFAMPGSLFASTSFSVAEAEQGPVKTAAELVMEEMNRRAAETKAEAVKNGTSLPGDSMTSFRGGKKVEKKASPKKGTKEAFDLIHQKAFAKMESITSHYAAKRPNPYLSASGSSINPGSGMARSSSSRTLSSASATEERAAKRLKPSSSRPFGLNQSNRIPASTSSKKLVDGLRAAGWSAAPTPATSVSLAASVRSTVDKASTIKGKEKGVREDLKPDAQREREMRKRQLKMAKARRKSQAGAALAGAGPSVGMGMRRKRLSMSVGPKPTGSTASRFLKSTFKKLAPSISSSRPILAASSSTLATTKPLPTIPRFASSTASTSSRTSVIPSTSRTSPVGSLKQKPSSGVGPGWKKFDLQESLKRPTSWKMGSSSSSASFSGASSSLTGNAKMGGLVRKPSGRVANPGLLGAVKPAGSPPSPVKEEQTLASSPPSQIQIKEEKEEERIHDPLDVVAKLAALPSAPSTVFGPSTSSSSTATAAPFGQVTNTLSPPSSVKPSLAGKKPQPSASSSTATPGATGGRKAGGKITSSSTRLARGGEKVRAMSQVEGLQSRARG